MASVLFGETWLPCRVCLDTDTPLDQARAIGQLLYQNPTYTDASVNLGHRIDSIAKYGDAKQDAFILSVAQAMIQNAVPRGFCFDNVDGMWGVWADEDGTINEEENEE